MAADPRMVWMPGGTRTEIHLGTEDTAGAYCLLVDHPPAGWSLQANAFCSAFANIIMSEIAVLNCSVSIFSPTFLIVACSALTRSAGSAALALLWEAAGLSPRDPEIQTALGEALERIGAFDAAIGAYRVALEQNPQFRKASNNLILALVKAGRSEEAIARAQALVDAAPKDPDRYFTLGLAQSEQNIDAAMQSFRRALELNPRHALARRGVCHSGRTAIATRRAREGDRRIAPRGATDLPPRLRGRRTTGASR